MNAPVFRLRNFSSSGLVIAGSIGILLGLICLFILGLSPDWIPLVFLAVLFPFVLCIIGNTRKVLIALLLLEIPFRLDIYLGYRAEALKYGALVGYGISITTICLIGLYALWGAELAAKRRSFQRLLPSSYLPLLFYLIFVVLSLFAAKDMTYSLYEISMLVQTFLLFLYFIGTIHTRQDVIFIITMLLIGLVLESLVMIWMGITGHEFSFAGISTRIQHGLRVGGTIGSPIIAASYLGLLVTLAFSLLLTKLEAAYKLLAILGFGLGAVAQILTFSRASWFGFLLSMTIVLGLSWRRGWLSIKIPIVTIFLLATLWLFFHDAITLRLLGDDLGSANSRIPLMIVAFRIIRDHPVFGVGANNFGLVFTQYITPDLGNVVLYAVHNKFLLVWAETGIGALISFLFFIGLAIKRGWQVWKSNDRFYAVMGLGLAAPIIGQIPHMFVDVFHERSQVQLLFIISALILAIYAMNRENS